MTRSLWNPLDKENIIDPYPMYERLRKEQPVYKAQTGEWIITRYEDVRNILKSKEFLSGNKIKWIEKGIDYFNNKDLDLSAIKDAINSFLLFLNGDRHRQLRQLISRAWDDREVDAIILDNIHSLLEKAGTKKELDIVEEFAQPLPSMSIARIMGLPFEDYELLRSRGIDLIRVLDLYLNFKDLVEIEASSHFLVQYFENHIRKIRDKPGDDLIGKIIKLNDKEPEPASEKELVSLCVFLFLAGEETTISLIGKGIFHLLQHPDQYELLAKDNDLAAIAIEELLRYDAPAHVVGRIASKDIELNGHVIKKGDTCTLCLASANRDETVFKNADEFLIHRTPNRHLAFGGGVHFCLGDWLGKRQGMLAIQQLVKTIPGMEYVEGSASWNNNLSVRSLNSIKIRF